jgi:type III secretion protein J
LGVVLALAFSGCTVELQHDLSEDDANDIYVLLQRNGIEAKKLKEEGGNVPKYIISVGKQDVATAAQLLRDYALPEEGEAPAPPAKEGRE